MKVSLSDKKSWHIDRLLMADILLALAVAVVFALFSATVMEMDAFMKNHPPIPPGRIVYM